MVTDKVYKLCDFKEYTENMTVYLANDRKCASPSVTATHWTSTGHTPRIRNVGHKTHTDNLFWFPHLFDEYILKTTNFCDVKPSKACMPKYLRKTLEFKWNDKEKLTVKVWKEMICNMLINMHWTPAEGTFHDRHGGALKPSTVHDYNWHT